MKITIITTVMGAGIGYFVGSTLGIAGTVIGFPIATSVAVPGMILGGVIGSMNK
jgi:ABC-type antimicrobial peptide transport system permease subunit